MSKDNPVGIITKNTSGEYFARHIKRITEGELWEIVDTGGGDFRDTRVTDVSYALCISNLVLMAWLIIL